MSTGSVSELERAFAEVTSLDEIASDLLTQLQSLAGATAGLLFGFDASGAPVIHGGSLAPAMRDYTRELFAIDLVQEYNRSLPANTFLPTCQGFDHQAFLGSRAYVDFYRHHDLGFLQSIWPTGQKYGSEGMFGLELAFPRAPGRVEERTLHLLGQLEAPMRAAARRISRFTKLGQCRDALGHVLGNLGGALVLWDRDAQLVWMSQHAKALLQRKQLRTALGEVAARASRQLCQARAAQSGPGVLGRAIQIGGACEAALIVEFSCLRPLDGRPWLLAELRRSEGIHAGLARLTPAEMRVLQQLVRGLSNGDIASKLCVSKETVKTHVARILEKLSVDSRAKAAAVARDAGVDRARPWR